MKEIEIILNDKPVIVKKIPLAKYATILRAIEDLPKLISIVQDKSQDEILRVLPDLIDQCLPDIKRIIKVTLEIPQDEIEQLGAADLVIIIEAFLETNDFGLIYEKIKKVTARPTDGKLETQTKMTS